MIGRGAALAVLMAVPPVSAQTVQELLPMCEKWLKEDYDYEAYFCMGQAIGAGGITYLNCQSSRSETAPALPHPRLSSNLVNVSNAAKVQAFVNWARANPQHWGLSAEFGISFALSDTFPCD